MAKLYRIQVPNEKARLGVSKTNNRKGRPKTPDLNQLRPMV